MFLLQAAVRVASPVVSLTYALGTLMSRTEPLSQKDQPAKRRFPLTEFYSASSELHFACSKRHFVITYLHFLMI